MAPEFFQTNDATVRKKMDFLIMACRNHFMIYFPVNFSINKIDMVN